MHTYDIHTSRLKEKLIDESSGKYPALPRHLPLIFPPIKLCTDNGKRSRRSSNSINKSNSKANNNNIVINNNTYTSFNNSDSYSNS